MIGTSRLDRICEFCTMNVVEDEEHFITSCPLYSVNRANLYRELNNIGCENWINCNTTSEKLSYILQPVNIRSTKLVITYIKSCFETRKLHSHVTV